MEASYTKKKWVDFIVDVLQSMHDRSMGGNWKDTGISTSSRPYFIIFAHINLRIPHSTGTAKGDNGR